MATFYVSPDNGASNRLNLAEALRNAGAGDVVHLAAGVYPGDLSIRKNICLFGVGPTVVIQGCIEIEAAVVHLSDLTVNEAPGTGIRVTGPNTTAIVQRVFVTRALHSGILFDNAARGRILSVHITRSGGRDRGGLAIVRGASPYVLDCIISDLEAGLFIGSGTQPTIERLEISRVSYGAVVVGVGAAPQISGLRMRDVRRVGIAFSNAASGELRGADLSHCGTEPAGGPGVLVLDATPTLVDCLVHDTPNTGISILGGARPRIQGGEIWACGKSAIQVLGEGTAPQITRTLIRKVGGAGIEFSDRAGGTVSQVDISACGRDSSGIYVSGAANPALVDCRIHDTQADGIAIAEGARPRVEGGEICDCGRQGISVTGKQTQPHLTRVRVHNVIGAAAMFADSAKGVLLEADISRCSDQSSAIVISCASPVIADCFVHDTLSPGIWVMDAAQPRLLRIKLSRCATPAIRVEPNASPEIRACEEENGLLRPEVEKASSNHPRLSSGWGTEVPLEIALQRLNQLVGLEAVKSEVNKLIDMVQVRSRRRSANLPVTDVSLHMVFAGNPGTGKTTVARIMGEIFLSLGLLQRGHVVEVQRADLVSEYVGKTAQLVVEKVQSAEHGVLFIDEAYTLSRRTGGHADFGQEAIDTLLREMEERRGKLSVIVAGYRNEMQEFIGSNPGLRSRFTRLIEFADYSPAELREVYLSLCDKNGLVLAEGCDDRLGALIAKLYRNRGNNFGNARDIRTTFEATMERQAGRLVMHPVADVRVLLPEDIPASQVPTRELKSVLEVVNSLVGLTDVKREIHQLVNFAQMQTRRPNIRLLAEPVSLRMAFYGAPGSGKTTIALLLGEIFACLGLLEKGHLVLTQRADLVGSQTESTTDRVAKKVNEAAGGILFIEEAPTLVIGEQDGAGTEAVNALIREMDRRGGNFSVILAGEAGKMKAWLRSQQRLKSRVFRQILFAPYTETEMLDLFVNFCSIRGYRIHPLALSEVKKSISVMRTGSDTKFNNSHDARIFSERVIERQANRIMHCHASDPSLLSAEDVVLTTRSPVSKWNRLMSAWTQSERQR